MQNGSEEMAPDDQFEIHNHSAVQIMLAELEMKAGSSNLTRTIAKLLGRMRLSIGSLTRLCKDNPNTPQIDGVSILRSIYEAHLQVLYILKEPATRVALYNDFLWIDWRKFKEVVLSQSGKFFDALAASKKRVNEPQMLAEYERVQATYRKGKGHRRDWYEGSLEDIARELGYEGEFLALSRYINPTIHSSAYGLRDNAGMDSNAMIYIAWQFLHRCMGRVIEHEGLTKHLPGVQHRVALSLIQPGTAKRVQGRTQGRAASPAVASESNHPLFFRENIGCRDESPTIS